MGKKILIIACLVSIALSGCVPKPRSGGGTRLSTGYGYEAPSTLNVEQSEDPSESSGGSINRSQSRDGNVPILTERRVTETKPDGGIVETVETFHVGSMIEKVEVNATTKVGPTFWDSSREIAAKIGAMRPMQIFGTILMVAAAVGLFYAPVRVILGGGKQLPMAIGAIGLALVLSPQLIAGNEKLVIMISAVGLLFYWLTIRLTRKEAEADHSKQSNQG